MGGAVGGMGGVGGIDAALSELIFSGVFERYPNLTVGSVEFAAGWAPLFIRNLDRRYMVNPRDGYRFKNGALPSDFMHRNVFITFQDDDLGIRMRDIIGVDNLLFGNDYPHHNGTWPRSRQMLEQFMVDCTEEEKAKIAGGNALRVYNIE